VLHQTAATVANLAAASDNRLVGKQDSFQKSAALPGTNRDPFGSGAVVIVTLGNPREKFWGMVLALAPEGLSLSGIELASFEDLAVLVKEGEPYTAAVVFFPMHRIERVELDLPDGNLPSLSQRFLAKTGRQPSSLLGPALVNAGSGPDGSGADRSRPSQPEESA
jgi:hypothetical protein